MPFVVPGPLGPAVDQEDDRVFLGGVEARRTHQPALNTIAVGTGKLERFGRLKVEIGDELCIVVSEPRRRGLFLEAVGRAKLDSLQLSGLRDPAACEHEALALGRNAERRGRSATREGKLRCVSRRSLMSRRR